MWNRGIHCLYPLSFMQICSGNLVMSHFLGLNHSSRPAGMYFHQHLKQPLLLKQKPRVFSLHSHAPLCLPPCHWSVKLILVRAEQWFGWSGFGAWHSWSAGCANAGVAQGGRWGGRKNQEKKPKNKSLCGTAAGLALLAARRGSQDNLLACCCQKHQSHTLLPPLPCTCLQLWSQALLACASLKSKWPCSGPAQLIKPWNNCWCVLTALELEQLTEGTEEYRARAREVEGVHGQQAGRQAEEKDRRTSPF